MGDCWVKMMRVDGEGVVFLISEVNLKMKIEDWFFFFRGGFSE